MSYEMSSEIKFEGSTESESLSQSYQASVQNDTEQTYSYDVSADIEVSCTAQAAADGVGLWQFVTETTDRASRVSTTHTVCRYGANYNHAPACPWNACLDGECNTCATDWRA